MPLRTHNRGTEHALALLSSGQVEKDIHLRLEEASRRRDRLGEGQDCMVSMWMEEARKKVLGDNPSLMSWGRTKALIGDGVRNN